MSVTQGNINAVTMQDATTHKDPTDANAMRATGAMELIAHVCCI